LLLVTKPLASGWLFAAHGQPKRHSSVQFSPFLCPVLPSLSCHSCVQCCTSGWQGSFMYGFMQGAALCGVSRRQLAEGLHTTRPVACSACDTLLFFVQNCVNVGPCSNNRSSDRAPCCLCCAVLPSLHVPATRRCGLCRHAPHKLAPWKVHKVAHSLSALWCTVVTDQNSLLFVLCSAALPPDQLFCDGQGETPLLDLEGLQFEGAVEGESS
jgi:hypothetical protein